jgi:hypothetical protein
VVRRDDLIICYEFVILISNCLIGKSGEYHSMFIDPPDFKSIIQSSISYTQK